MSTLEFLNVKIFLGRLLNRVYSGVGRRLFAVGFIVLVSGCAINPVTGKQELHFISETQEIQLGEENYVPAQQSQGGQYVVDPALTHYVNEVGQRLVKVSDRAHLPYEFVVLNNSVPNAWAMPGGKMAVNRGLLLELNNEAELAAVLGHEIVHAAARHGARGLERGILLQAGVAGVGVAAAATGSDYTPLLVGAAGVGAQLLNQRYSRDQERESDHYGMLYMSRASYDPMAAVTLQETFVRLSKNKESNWLEGLFASHPPSQERVDANREAASKLPPGGRLGREEYQAGIAGLKRSKEAYESYDQGEKALKEGDAARALALAEKALRIEPREALFYGLRGDALAKQGKDRAALTEYQKAIELNKDFFDPYLQRGLLLKKLDDDATARWDLEMSNRLLPTAVAHYALGEIALQQRQLALAREHFRVVAASNSPLGEQARAQLARLERGLNP